MSMDILMAATIPIIPLASALQTTASATSIDIVAVLVDIVGIWTFAWLDQMSAKVSFWWRRVRLLL